MKTRGLLVLMAAATFALGQDSGNTAGSTSKNEKPKTRHVKGKHSKRVAGATSNPDSNTQENPMDPKGPTNPRNPVPPRTPINPDTPAGPKAPPRPPSAAPPQ
ncbi:MAG: hypothetical protein M3Z85_01210 [Acidobacteriota bacterium]|nr:hypothetical protein [Acidobacteriota bacterium]